MHNQLLAIGCGLVVIFVLINLTVWRNRKRDKWAAHDAQIDKECEELAQEAKTNAEVARLRDQERRQADYQAWESYIDQVDAAEAALRAVGTPAAWRVTQDSETGKWRIARPSLYIPHARDKSLFERRYRMPPKVIDVEWCWQVTRAEFASQTDALNFVRQGNDPNAYLLDAQGEIVKTEPAYESEDEDDDV